MNMHISFIPEKILEIGNIGITNSALSAIVFVGFATIVLLLISFSFRPNKPSSLQLYIESLYDGLYGMAENILGAAGVKKYFSFLLTFFVFILASNLGGLMPFVPAIGKIEHHEESATEETHAEEEYEAKCMIDGSCLLTTEGFVKNEHFVPIFRAPTADLSSVLTLAFISVIVTNIIGFTVHKFGYLKKYLNFSSPIDFIVGILEIISEFGKIISFAFRLFGNVFAGEVLLAVLTALTFGIATLPFLGLELFVSFVQAFVFFMLTAVFISLAKDTHH